METLRQVMAFPMMAAAVWMASVLAALTGSTGVILLLGAMLAAGLGAWIWGRWGVISRPAGTRVAAGVLAVLLVASGTVAVAGLLPRGRAAGTPAAASEAAHGVGTLECGAPGPAAAARHAGVRGLHGPVVPELPGE